MSLMKKLKLREVEDWPVVTQVDAVDSGLSWGPHSWVPHLSNPSSAGSNGPLGPEEGAHEKRRSVSERHQHPPSARGGYDQEAWRQGAWVRIPAWALAACGLRLRGL